MERQEEQVVEELQVTQLLSCEEQVRQSEPTRVYPEEQTQVPELSWKLFVVSQAGHVCPEARQFRQPNIAVVPAEQTHKLFDRTQPLLVAQDVHTTEVLSGAVQLIHPSMTEVQDLQPQICQS